MPSHTSLELLRPPDAGGRYDTALLGLRLFVGSAFWFHGTGKIGDLAAFASEFHIPVALAAVAASTQIAGAVLLVAGFLTPAAALSLGATMAVAMMQLIARGERFVDPTGHSWEPAAFYLVANLVLVLTGPGRWSLDALLWSRRERARAQLLRSDRRDHADCIGVQPRGQ